ncbi:putative armadillo-like helical protein [Lupinus albus]|uniref:Putative armadillo-like helical protein n=1 Tax=Lupinus albus TaxID=3870 RepID=A0A6A4R486_LUPAL|nr:putative armadillo-like helical protein [Lupinus albus]
MSRQPDILFLEEWLKSRSGDPKKFSPKKSYPLSARAIIQAWAELRDSLQQPSFHQHHLQHLKSLVSSQSSLHVADPQARLVLRILSSSSFSLPYESYPLLFRLLYIWVRKAYKPTSDIIDSAMEVLSHLFSSQFDSGKNPVFFSEGILLLGAFSFVPSSSERSKTVCLDLLSRQLIEKCQFLGSFTELVPDFLAGIGYALSSSVTVHYHRILNSLFEIWHKDDGPQGNIFVGLMVLHLIDWVMTNLINFQFLDKIHVFLQETFGSLKEHYASFAVFMAAAGVLRVVNRSASSSMKLEILSTMRVSAVGWMEALINDLVSGTLRFNNSGNDHKNRLLLQCVSVALARTGSFSGHSSFFVCLALALLTEIFPLPRLYKSVIEPSNAPHELKLNEVKEHLDNILFQEAGAITAIFCNLYVSADEENKNIVENLIWEYCRDIYFGHRQVALVLKGKEDELLEGLEKIAESAFLMAVVFALAVTKHKLNSKFAQEIQTEVSLRILVSFSCVEYFRHVRLPEYMETIRKVVATVNSNEHTCTSFLNSMPSYVDLTNGPDPKTKYLWSEDKVQTARILFYLRVIPTFIECLPSNVFSNVVAPTMFLYLEHPDGKVAQASHSLFVAFMSMGKESKKTDRVSLKEQLVFHYIQTSLLGYPLVTPFEGMASGVVGVAQHLPAGSPATFYCIHSLVEKANQLCSEVFTHEADAWKKRQGEPEPSKKLMDLILRLVFLVDIQVLPDLMKLLAQLITALPQDAQNMVLNELYSLVADSDDVIRKPTLVSWLQSLSYLCTSATHQNAASKKGVGEDNLTSASIQDPLSSGRLTAQL